MIDFTVSTVINKSNDRGGYLCYSYNNMLVHINRSSGSTICLVTDEHYDKNVCRQLFHAIENNLDQTKPNELDQLLNQLIVEYSDPQKVDRMAKITDGVKDIKQIMTKNVNVLLHQGETIDSLVDRSDELTSNSKRVYRTAKRFNRCSCAVQ